jgi:hypothetical protein
MNIFEVSFFVCWKNHSYIHSFILSFFSLSQSAQKVATQSVFPQVPDPVTEPELFKSGTRTGESILESIRLHIMFHFLAFLQLFVIFIDENQHLNQFFCLFMLQNLFCLLQQLPPVAGLQITCFSLPPY